MCKRQFDSVGAHNQFCRTNHPLNFRKKSHGHGPWQIHLYNINFDSALRHPHARMLHQHNDDGDQNDLHDNARNGFEDRARKKSRKRKKSTANTHITFIQIFPLLFNRFLPIIHIYPPFKYNF